MGKEAWDILTLYVRAAYALQSTKAPTEIHILLFCQNEDLSVNRAASHGLHLLSDSRHQSSIKIDMGESLIFKNASRIHFSP